VKEPFSLSALEADFLRELTLKTINAEPFL
jgi:hypothetical protein